MSPNEPSPPLDFKLLLLDTRQRLLRATATINIFIFHYIMMNDDKDVKFTICECSKHRKYLSKIDGLSYVINKFVN